MRDLAEVWKTEKAVFGWSGVYLKLKSILFWVQCFWRRRFSNHRKLIDFQHIYKGRRFQENWKLPTCNSKVKLKKSFYKQKVKPKTHEQWLLGITLQSRVDLKVVLITNQDKTSTNSNIPLSPAASEFITITGAFPLAESV